MNVHCGSRRILLASVAVAQIGALTPPSVGAQQLSYMGSVQGATGDYLFAARTNSVSLTNGFVVDAGRLHLSMSLPLLYQSQPWVTYTGAGPIPTGGPQHGTVSATTNTTNWRRHRTMIVLDAPDGIDELGIGDPTAFVELDFVDGTGARPALRVTVAAKAPLADADAGFGTGAWDIAGGLALSKATGRATLFAEGAYWVLGDMPDMELRNVVAYGIGIGAPLGRGPVAAVACLSGATAAIAGTRAPTQTGLALRYRRLTGGTVTAGISVGLTSTAPDVRATVGWEVLLNGTPRVIAARSLHVPYPVVR